jgi:hypothetical protein
VAIAPGAVIGAATEHADKRCCVTYAQRLLLLTCLEPDITTARTFFSPSKNPSFETTCLESRPERCSGTWPAQPVQRESQLPGSALRLPDPPAQASPDEVIGMHRNAASVLVKCHGKFL